MSQISVYNAGGGGGAGFVKTLSGDMGGSIPPDVSGNIAITGAHDIVTMAVGNTIFISVKNSISLGDLSPIVGLPAAEFNTGDLSILHGSIKLPTTTTDSLEGVIYQNGISLLQTLGTNNLFIGSSAGNFTFNQGSATGNTALGATNLSLLTTGANNTALGNQAGLNIEDGSQNTLVGVMAGDGISSGANNIMVGYAAGTALTTSESSNILIGNTGTIGDNNTIRIGTQGSGTGQQNKAFMAGIIGVTVGSPSAVVIDTATGQLGVGSPGGSPIETITGDTGGPEVPLAGNFNIFGAHGINVAGSANTETVAINNAITLGDLASIIGSPALTATTGDVTLLAGNINLPVTSSTLNEGVITVGGVRFMSSYSAAPLVQPGSTFLGYTSGPGPQLTFATTGIGFEALMSINTSSSISNTAVGAGALTMATATSDNTAIGAEALAEYTAAIGGASAGSNVAIGASAAATLTTGENNIIIGTGAGSAYTTSESSNILIGNAGINGESNTIRIGVSGSLGGEQNRCFIAGIDGVNVGSTATIVTETSDQLGTAVLTAGANITITPGANTITIAAATSSVTAHYTGVNHAASPYTVLSTDYYISADVTAGVITILLPNAPTTGRVFVVKDKVGLAATSNITVTTVGGAVTIDGATSFVMNTAYESVQLIFNGTSYEIF